jgi:hypothetical protein
MNGRIINGQQILWDGQTVWINAPSGECLGRFGAGGIDFHRTMAEQMAGHPECLECTHHRPAYPEWERFVALVKEVLGVELPLESRPSFIKHTEPLPEKPKKGRGG